jgi:hypothetical protein
MVYQVKRTNGDKKPFEFELDGVTYSVPLVKHLTVEQIESIEEGQAAGMGVRAIVAVFGDAAPAVRKLDQEEFLDLSKAWSEASGVSLGELLSSAG